MSRDSPSYLSHLQGLSQHNFRTGAQLETPCGERVSFSTAKGNTAPAPAVVAFLSIHLTRCDKIHITVVFQTSDFSCRRNPWLANHR